MGISSTFYIASQSLQVALKAMEVASHNISNVNTDGYSRQVANLATTEPVNSSYGQIGTGVNIDAISRMFDQFIQRNLVDKTSLLAKYESQKTSIDAIESTFNESSGNGINQALSDFWSAWQDVANNPEGNAERMNLIEKTDTLTKSINIMRQDMDKVKTDINSRVEQNVNQVNTLVSEIAAINQKITAAEAGRQGTANDLRDQRDQHIKELSGLMDINYFEDPSNHAVSVMTSKGTPLVQGTTAWSLKAITDPVTANIQVQWQSIDGGTIDITPNISNGQLGGLIELRDKTMKDFYLQFESFTDGLITKVNNQYCQGVGLTTFTDTISSYNLSDYSAFKTEMDGDNNDLTFKAMIPGTEGDKIKVKFLKAASVSDTLHADVVPQPAYPPPNPTSYEVTFILPINDAGQITATANDIVKYVKEHRTSNLPYPAPLPPTSAGPWSVGDVLDVELAHHESGTGIVTDTLRPANDPKDANGFYSLNHNLENVLVYGNEIKWKDNAGFQTKLDGDNNDLNFSVKPDWLAANPTRTGEEISVRYQYTGLANQAPSVGVGANNDITITLATDAQGRVTTTANDIIALINNDPTASGMIDVTRVTGNSGDGVIPTPQAAVPPIDPLPTTFLDRSATFDLVVYDRDGKPTTTTIKVRPTDTKQDVMDQINAIRVDGDLLAVPPKQPTQPITASAHLDSGENFIRLTGQSGYTFAFANDTANALTALGLNNFFSGSDTSTIKINDILTENIQLIASGRVDSDGQMRTGDNSNALDTADVKDLRFIIHNQNCTISEAYNSLVADVGANTQAITQNNDFNQALVNQILTQRDNVSAVNLDEEMADILKFQYMYQASAKMISTVDQMLQTLLAVKS